MRLKKALQRLTAFFVMLSLTVTCYALDLDKIFNIQASAASYKDRATSMLQLYKEGAKLDRKSVSNDELYVFGVFVSNFLMPFQSNVGYMSSDSFVTKMAQTFFGDAYTAQQFSDMKYTLGLVQSAQNSRRKLVDVESGANTSFDTLYRNFGGFYAPTQQLADSSKITGQTLNTSIVRYTYEGSESIIDPTTNKSYRPIVWQSGIDMFDAVLGQVISVCPSQAGVYMGTNGKPTSPLSIDCFGNISDAEGVVIIPACMNPYSFYNHYLDADRTPKSTADRVECPLQLPINNAFWMGTTVTPQDLVSRVQDTSSEIESGASSAKEEIYLVIEYGGGGIHNQVGADQYSTGSISIDALDDDSATTPDSGWHTALKIRLIGQERTPKQEGKYYQGAQGKSNVDFTVAGGQHSVRKSDGKFDWIDYESKTITLANDFTPTDNVWEKDTKDENPCLHYVPADKFFNTANITDSVVVSDDYLPAAITDFIAHILPPGVDAVNVDSDIWGVFKAFSDYWVINRNDLMSIKPSLMQDPEKPITKVGLTNDVFSVGYTDVIDARRAAETKIGEDYLIHYFYGEGGTTFYSGSLNARETRLYGNWRMSIQQEVDGKASDLDTSKTEAHTSYGLKRTLIALPDLWQPVQSWTNSTTALIGISTLDGSELGIYFDPAIQKNFLDAWALKTGNQDKKLGDLTTGFLVTGKQGYIDTWNFIGGTSVPIGQVLDDIALFDTYNNFSDSVMETIRPISMYTDSDGSFHAEKGNGTKITSIYSDIITLTTEALNQDVEFTKLYYAGKVMNAKLKSTSGVPTSDTYDFTEVGRALLNLVTLAQGDTLGISDYFDDSTADALSSVKLLNALEDKIRYPDKVSLTAPNNALSELMSIANELELNVSATDDITSILAAFEAAASKTDELSTKLKEAQELINNSGASVISAVKKYLSTNLRDVAWADKMSFGEWNELAERAILTVCLGDPLWLAYESSPLITRVMYNTPNIANAVNGYTEGAKALYSSTIPHYTAQDDTTVAWSDPSTWGNAFNEAVYTNHTFLQKAHPSMQGTTTLSGGGVAFLKGLLLGVTILAAIVVVAAVVLTNVVTGGAPGWVAALASVASKLAVKAICLEVALLTVTVYTDVKKHSSIGDQKTALNNYFDAVSKYCYGYEQVKAAMAASSLNADNPEIVDRLDNKNPMIYDLITAYGGKTDNPGDEMTKLVGNAYVLDYTLYSPYGSLGTALGAISKVQTQQGIVDGDKIYDKVGSFITIDANLWGGIYYAYMIDIFGLTIEDGVMSCAQLKTNFPPIPSDLTAKTNPDLSALFNEGDEIDTEEEETKKRRELIDRMSEMTDVNATDYVGNWLTNTVNSWILKTHASICGASEAGSIGNIGGGTQYTGYSGYLATATLSEMPFTSWVMEYYNIIYMVLLVLVFILVICMVVTGHRTILKGLLALGIMAIVLLLPKLTLDTIVTVSNNIAQDVYKDRFNFWAYAQYQQYITKLADAEEKDDEIEFLIVTNIQQATDYYSEEKGVTLKWMSPKKRSYWDQLNSITGGSEDGLNLSIFKWMFQGQFKQEMYSTDGMATYLYRPFNDISMTARTFAQKRATSPVDPSQYSTVLGVDTSYADTSCDRERNLYITGLANSSYIESVGTDTDIIPAYIQRSGSGYSYVTTPGYSTALSGTKWYATGLANEQVYNIAFAPDTFAKLDFSGANSAEYAKNYPSSKASDTTVSSADVGIPIDLEEGNISSNLKLFYLYNESPYYYFYFMFQDMADRYAFDSETGKGSIRKLLLCKDYFKYTADIADNNTISTQGADTKGQVSEGEFVDYLDLQGLFTYVIPYLHQSNQYVIEWTDLWGTEPTGDEVLDTELRQIWNMYSPWVDAMYETTYHDDTMRVGGKRVVLEDAINPGSYMFQADTSEGVNTRQMMFSPAQMQRNWTVEADLTQVEKRIMKTLEDTYTDLMYLNNYTTFDDDVLLSAMAMIATFNFNQNFSDNQLFGANITLYPTGFEVKNFSYDSFLRMSLLNTTGESVFSEEDIYTTVIQKSSFFTGLLILLNDLIAVYAIPAMKLVLLLGLFFLGLLICTGGFLSPPNNMLKFIAKSFLLPLGIFAAILLANTGISALFVGEGMTSMVGQRGVTITTGDPTITILLMLAINVLVLWGFFKTLKFLLKSFKISLTWVGAAAAGFVAAAAGKALAVAKFGKRAALGAGKVATAPVRKAGKAIGNAIDKDMDAKRLANAINGKGKKKKKGSEEATAETGRGKDSEEAPKARFTKTSQSGTTETKPEGEKQPEGQSALDKIKNRDTYTRDNGDGTVTTVTAATTEEDRKKALAELDALDAKKKANLQKYQKQRADEFDAQSEARGNVENLVGKSFEGDYNAATKQYDDLVNKIMARGKAKGLSQEQISKQLQAAGAAYKSRIDKLDDKKRAAVDEELTKRGLTSYAARDAQLQKDEKTLERFSKQYKNMVAEIMASANEKVEIHDSEATIAARQAAEAKAQEKARRQRVSDAQIAGADKTKERNAARLADLEAETIKLEETRRRLEAMKQHKADQRAQDRQLENLIERTKMTSGNVYGAQTDMSKRK